MKQTSPDIQKTLSKHGISSTNALLIFLSFWVTVLLVRGIIFEMINRGSIPAIFVKGFHIHHFITGFILLLFAVVLMTKKIWYKHIPVLLLGCGTALVFDEFIFWTSGQFEYWDMVNFLAVASLGLILAGYYEYTRQKSKQEKVPLKKEVGQWSLVLLPVILAILVMLNWYSYHNTLAAKAERKILPISEHKIKTFPVYDKTK